MATITLINVIPYAERARTKRITYEQLKKACGKPSCRVCGGQRPAHGPYWYKVEWDATARKQRTVYIGKQLPPEAEEALQIKRLLAASTWRQRLQHTHELAAALTRQQQENIALRARIARLEAALAVVRAQLAHLERQQRNHASEETHKQP